MKLKGILFFFAVGCLPLSASITLNVQLGVAYDSLNSAVPDGTLWMLTSSPDANFAGGFGLDQGLSTSGDADSVFSAGQALQVGNILGGDQIFAMGAFNGAASSGVTGIYAAGLSLNLGINGLDQGDGYAFYWFPGSTFTGSGTEVVGNEVGGVNSNTVDPLSGTNPMVIPADGVNTLSQGAADDLVLGGATPAANLTAVVLVPEPSTLLLSALGVLALLRRKR